MRQLQKVILLLLLVSSCKQESSIHKTSIENNLSIIFEEYNKFKDRINPIEATKGGNFEYNDLIANYISDAYQKELIEEYKSFLNRLSELDENKLSKADQLSMNVMKWDCKMKLEGLQSPIVVVTSPMYNLPSFELMPLTQIQSLHLYVAQLAAGGSVHPFNTVKDFEDWLSDIWEEEFEI